MLIKRMFRGMLLSHQAMYITHNCRNYAGLYANNVVDEDGENMLATQAL